MFNITLEEYDKFCELYKEGRAPWFRQMPRNNEWLIENINRYCGNIFLKIDNGSYKPHIDQKYHIKKEIGILDLSPYISNFWDNIYQSGGNREFIGVPKDAGDVRYIFNEYRKPVYMDFNIPSKHLVICLERINEMSTEDKLLSLLDNLTDFSNKYIVLLAWAEDMNVKSKVESRKHYWDMDIYKWYILEDGFKEIVRMCVPDYINMFYIFERF